MVKTERAMAAQLLAGRIISPLFTMTRKSILRALLLLPLLLPALYLKGQQLHHYVAAVQGIETSGQEKELIHYLRTNDPGGRYMVDRETGDVIIHTTTLLRSNAFGDMVNSLGLILLHFQEVRPEAAPRRRRNQRSA
jgi:hypothetical protein